jgi:hypothetical protein
MNLIDPPEFATHTAAPEYLPNFNFPFHIAFRSAGVGIVRTSPEHDQNLPQIRCFCPLKKCSANSF